MKYVFCIFVLALCAISESYGASALGRCEPMETDAQCFQRRAKIYEGNCVKIVVRNGFIQESLCGSVFCGGSNVRKTPEDLSKPYPKCCSTCEIIDPNLLEYFSGGSS